MQSLSARSNRPRLATATTSLLVALLALAPAKAAAQRLHGAIVDRHSRAPLPAVLVAVLTEAGEIIAETTTDSAGRYDLRWANQSRVRLFAEALGYHTTRTEPFTMSPAESRPAYLFMSIDAVKLDPVTVTAMEGHASFPHRMAGFYARRQSGIGKFLTSDQIEASGHSNVSDLLTRIPGIVIRRNGQTTEAMTTLNTVLIGGASPGVVPVRQAQPGRRQGDSSPALSPPSSGPCPMQLFVDGNIWRFSPNGLDAIPVQEIEAIEIFRGLAEVPGEYSGEHARCGVIAIWTKRPG